MLAVFHLYVFFNKWFILNDLGTYWEGGKLELAGESCVSGLGCCEEENRKTGGAPGTSNCVFDDLSGASEVEPDGWMARPLGSKF